MIGLGPPAYLAVLRVDLAVPGARSLKDRRQVVVSLRDRLRARFEVSCHELRLDDPGRASLFVTSGGSDPGVLRAVLDRIRGAVDAHAGCVVVDAEGEVRGWPDPVAWPAEGLHVEEDEDV